MDLTQQRLEPWIRIPSQQAFRSVEPVTKLLMTCPFASGALESNGVRPAQKYEVDHAENGRHRGDLASLMHRASTSI